MSDRPSLLDQTLAAAGTVLRRLTDGVSFRPLPTIRDERGSVAEIFNPRWASNPDPLVFSYLFSIRLGVVKGWNLHREHQDRYVRSPLAFPCCP